MPLRPFHNPGAGFEYRLRVALALAAVALLGVLVIRLLLPWLVLGGIVGGAVWGWRRQRARQRALHQLFYDQIAAHQGRISVLDFAIAAQLTGSEARQFLDQRAKDFWGDFEPTPGGDVLYTFRSWSQTTADPAPTTTPAIALSLTAAALAQRLGCTEADLAIYRATPDLSAWSRDRDPDGCGWRYDQGSDRYWPVG
ncbi:hypothetical protein [Nodosilinea sp. E11]|uniref:hypothetical protein n=1 Tax=Nodosilinea sp. E11 TaxID=3037479 RepID=UPI0029347524|nr:hypothetical protein [Nodosilinea sp. E11]WOD39353.1 hypothetical protein RRF56_24410 [Nodosilinea sp. E11]